MLNKIKAKRQWKKAMQTLREKHSQIALKAWAKLATIEIPDYIDKVHRPDGKPIYYLGYKRRPTPEQYKYIEEHFEPHKHMNTAKCPYCGTDRQDLEAFSFFPCPNAPWHNDPELLLYILHFSGKDESWT